MDGGPMRRCETVCRQVLSLPVHPHLSDQDVEGIVGTIRALLGD
jgi:dTDP-4-amino-4,6-dideoxygalactose transaminase